jgi:ABC-type multidrug transport system ATPase subunit
VAASGPVLAVSGLTKRFGPRTVLDRISLEVAAGSVCALIGPNGSGKTTLLRCVVGADTPDEGEVRLLGFRLVETDPWARQLTASALDDIDFFPDLSVVEHLELLAYAHAAPDAAATVADVMTALSLDEPRDQLPGTLSSGQRRRLALASCFVRPRRLLLLDEPEQRLDAAGRTWLAGQLRRERDHGTAVLLASHDAELVRAVADHHVQLGE